MNWTYFYIYCGIQFIIYMLIFVRMGNTNKEEWKYTKYIHAVIIGGIIGLVFSTLSGIGLYYLKLFHWSLSIMSGLVVGVLSSVIHLFTFNFRIKREEKNKK